MARWRGGVTGWATRRDDRGRCSWPRPGGLLDDRLYERGELRDQLGLGDRRVLAAVRGVGQQPGGLAQASARRGIHA
jgi:hypothetical protein